MKIKVTLILGVFLIALWSCKDTGQAVTANTSSESSNRKSNVGYVNLDSLYDQVVYLKTRIEVGERLLAVQKNGKWGITNHQGDDLVDLAYDDVASIKSSFALKKNGNWSIHNDKLVELISIKCDHLEGHNETHYVASIKNRKALISDKTSMDFIFDEISGPKGNENYFYGKDGSWKAYHLSGIEIKKISIEQLAALKALNEYQVTLYGCGPIRLGMSEQEVEQAIGLTFLENRSSSDCKMMQFGAGFPAMGFLFDRKKDTRLLERIYINEPSIKTKSAIGIGSTEKEILNAYGNKMQKQKHKYSDQCVYYYYVPIDKNDQEYRLNFDYNFEEDRVRHYSVGRVPAIEYVEGCF